MDTKKDSILLNSIEMSQDEFQLFKDYIYKNIGIHLSKQKISLLRSRLNRRLFLLKFSSFKEYYEYLKRDEKEQRSFISAISTNVTYFFREENHWDFLSKNLKDIIGKRKKLRIWSSACSSGEEPYTINMFLHENMPDIANYDIKILATDISNAILHKAQRGIYLKEQVFDVPKCYNIKRYFSKMYDREDFLKIDKKIQEFIVFRTFNLVYGNYNLFKKTKFDIIFCRNVLIYFDEETKDRVAYNLANQLRDGGYLLIGHSESLMTHKNLKYVAPSIYQKRKG